MPDRREKLLYIANGTDAHKLCETLEAASYGLINAIDWLMRLRKRRADMVNILLALGVSVLIFSLLIIYIALLWIDIKRRIKEESPMNYIPKKCPDCGANLDPGDRCDCKNSI